MTDTAPLLDASQAASVRIAAHERQIVIAGPGSGKTEVVAALVVHLMKEENVDPEGGLLVISFSRAAVHAVTRRLAAVDAPSAAAVRTLDSLAAQIASESLDDDPTRWSFDERVRRAACALRDGKWDRAGEIEHLVVDEVQDVVGLRGDLLLALIDALDPSSGFTLLGDPAQAIYNFQLTHESTTTCEDVFRRVAALENVVTRRLTGSYRAWTPEAAEAVELRTGGAPDLADRSAELEDFVDSLVEIDDDQLTELLTLPGHPAALLTSTNGEALLEAERLWDDGVPALVRRPARDPVADRWVAESLGSRPSWSRDEILKVLGDDVLGASRWRALRTIAAPRGRRIDTKAVAAAIAGARLPAELVAQDPDVPVVSTIHRAKGLEFSTVVLARYPRRDDEKTDERTRTDYVAVTRARARLARISRRAVWGLARNSSTGRWERSGREKWQLRRFEMRGDDLDRRSPSGDGDASAVQRHLATSVHVGDPLTFELDWISADIPEWVVRHDGVEVGRTSERFGRDIARRLGRSKRWPDLAGGRVEAIETVAGPPQDDSADGVGAHGLWLGLRPVGLLYVGWSRDE